MISCSSIMMFSIHANICCRTQAVFLGQKVKYFRWFIFRTFCVCGCVHVWAHATPTLPLFAENAGFDLQSHRLTAPGLICSMLWDKRGHHNYGLAVLHIQQHTAAHKGACMSNLNKPFMETPRNYCNVCGFLFQVSPCVCCNKWTRRFGVLLQTNRSSPHLINIPLSAFILGGV